MSARRCLRCDGRMAEGFVIDQGQYAAQVSTWQAGAPQKSFWSGIKQVKTSQKPVATFRCDRCGYLESYAS